jgi:hypothetical protein
MRPILFDPRYRANSSSFQIDRVARETRMPAGERNGSLQGFLESAWDAKDRGVSRALDRGNIASRETRAIGRNGYFEPGFRRENDWAPARPRPLAKPCPCVELRACVHHANDGKAIRPQAIMSRQQLLWYVEESVERAHPDTSRRGSWHRGCVST